MLRRRNPPRAGAARVLDYANAPPSPPDPQLTSSTTPRGASVPALPAQFRFTSGIGRASHSEADLEEQLRQRLRFVAAVFLALCTVASVSLAVLSQAAARSVQSDLLLRVSLVLVPQAIVSAWFIWRLRPGATLGLVFLRRVELGAVAVGALTNFALLYVDFPSLVAVLPQASISLGVYSAGLCAVTLVAYGVLIPNTWRRCAMIIGAMIVVSVMADVTNVLRFHVPVATAVAFVFTKAAYSLVFGVLAAYGSFRIERSELAARAAEQLGQYVIRERLGSGGMGEVYKAEHQLLRRPCAVKLIRQEHAGDSDVLQRFEREVQATAALTHPNTVAIYDYGIAEDGTFYYVMEYLPGKTLEEIVRTEGPLPPARAVHLLRQVTSALHEAHVAGLTHRDIKPGNVMVCERGGIADVAKLLDFGLVVSGAARAGDPRLTQAGMIVGTPAYMSPEQCGGDEQPGPASDIYSLGALAYFLLSGKSPFEGKGPVQMLMAHMGEAPVSLASTSGDISPALDAVVMKCLAKQPRDRYASAAALELALSSL